MKRYVLSDLKKSRWLVAALWLIYAASYFVRACYAASIVAITDEGVYNKAEIGLIGTAFFVCYGIGQLISGIAGDRVNPFGMIAFGSAAGAVSCFMMSAVQSLPLLLAVWAANGFFQSMLWSPILRVFSNVMDKETGQKAVLNISLSLPVGTVAAYMLSTLIIKYYAWRRVFVCGGAAAAAVTLFFILVMLYVKSGMQIHTVRPVENYESRNKGGRRLLKAALAGGVFIIMIPSFLHGMLRDGITNWVPAMINEVYGVPASFSVFITIALPVCNAFGAYAAVPIYKRLGENEMKAAGVIGALSLIPLSLLLLISRLPVFAVILLLAVSTSMMYALNYLIISLVPVRFSGCSCTAGVSGILNSAAHIGCAVSSYGFGAVAETAGWKAVIAVWIAAAFITALICICKSREWGNYIKSDAVSIYFNE